jgi:hypothetical protein
MAVVVRSAIRDRTCGGRDIVLRVMARAAVV